MYRIGIDPGHGGNDPGAIGPSGLQEKEVNLDVALRLRRLLRDSGLKVIMTRESDVGYDLPWRVNLLNKAGCDLVVSLHCNSAKTLAEYTASFIVGKGGKAEIAATLIQKRLVEATGWPDGGVRTANFEILRETTAPAVLVEIGFISNPSQEKWLSNTTNRGILAIAIAQGVCDFLGVSFKPQSKDWEGHLHEAAIKEAMDLGLMAGTGEGNFAPDKPCSRAELAAVSVRVFHRVLDEIVCRMKGEDK